MKIRSYIDLEIEGDPVFATESGNNKLGDIWVVLECGRKNGQEDTHAYGVAVRDEAGNWEWSESECETFSEYHGVSRAVEILHHLDENDAEFTTLARGLKWLI